MFDISKLPIERYVVIGSYALGTRRSGDIDVICYRADINDSTTIEFEDNYMVVFKDQGKRIECLLADNQESLQIIYEINLRGCNQRIADIVTLYILKAGHIFFNTRTWEKHMQDYAVLLKMVGSTSYKQYAQRVGGAWVTVPEMVKLHYKCTAERIGNQRLPKLKNTTVEDFFNDAVVKYIEHDELHVIFAHAEVPMYTKMQRDPAFVDCDQQLWNNFSQKEKLWTVLEECYVIAVERIIIPSIIRHKEYNTHDAFKWALRRVCTDLTQGWFRQFALDNYMQLLNNYNQEFSNKLKGVDFASIR